MSYLEIIREVYKENRIHIRNYIIFAAVTSILLSFSGVGTVVLGAVSELTEEQTALLGGNSYKHIIILFNAIGIAIDSASVFALLAVISFIQYIFGVGGVLEVEQPTGAVQGLLSLDIGIMETLWIAITVMLIFLIPKICKMFGGSRILGITIDEIEQKIAGVFVIILTFYTWLDMQGGTMAANAAVTSSNGVVQTLGSIVDVVILFGLLILARLIFYIVGTVYFFFDIIMIPASAIPFTSVIIEAVKSIFILVLYYLANEHPEVFLVIAIILIVICTIIFRKAYIAVRYFKKIYVRPLLNKVFRKHKQFSIVELKIPKKLQKMMIDKKVDIALPIYPIRKFYGMEKIKKYEPWWLITSEGESSLYQTKFYWKKVKKIELISTEEKELYMQKSFRFIELFTLREGLKIKYRFSNGKKEMHFVLSKDYAEYYDIIRDTLGCRDFTTMKEEILAKQKMEKQQLKEIKKQEKLLEQQKN